MYLGAPVDDGMRLVKDTGWVVLNFLDWRAEKCIASLPRWVNSKKFLLKHFRKGNYLKVWKMKIANKFQSLKGLFRLVRLILRQKRFEFLNFLSAVLLWNPLRLFCKRDWLIGHLISASQLLSDLLYVLTLIGGTWRCFPNLIKWN